MPHLKADPRFVDNPNRTRNHAQLDPLLREHFITHPRAHWLALLSAAGVPCAPVSNVAEVARNPQLLERNMILPADHPTYDGLLVPGSPLKSAGPDSPPPTRAPALGEHTDSVLKNLLGYDQAQDGATARAGYHLKLNVGGLKQWGGRPCPPFIGGKPVTEVVDVRGRA